MIEIWTIPGRRRRAAPNRVVLEGTNFSRINVVADSANKRFHVFDGFSLSANPDAGIPDLTVRVDLTGALVSQPVLFATWST